MVSIAEALKKSVDILSAKAVPSPLREAQILLADILGKDMVYLKIHPDELLTDDIMAKLSELSIQRAEGRPMAYILGRKEFMSLEFIVNENVLIPRPETEEIAELIIDYAGDRDIELLDLCTGSGAICCSVAHYCKNLCATGADISDEALFVAKENAQRLGLTDRVSFIKKDILKGGYDRKYDIVVSNPPYIESKTIRALEPTVRDFEPSLALDGGEDGLMFYRAIINNIETCLKKEGMLFLEIGYNQAEAVLNELNGKFRNICVIKDLSGHDRIIRAQLA